MTTKLYSAFFSPTGTTHSVLKAAGSCIDQVSEIDLGLAPPTETITLSEDDLLIVGGPVYGGRLPPATAERLRLLKGNNTPVAAVVVYGNRAYGDALLELCDICKEQGFKVVSAAAFIGQHSFSCPEFPIAVDRPDQADRQKAKAFGEQFVKRVEQNKALDVSTLPGDRPLKAAMDTAGCVTGTNTDTCTKCGKCAEACPMQCISMANGYPETNEDQCIWCVACLQQCPTGARILTSPKITEVAERLHHACTERMEPVCFPAS